MFWRRHYHFKRTIKVGELEEKKRNPKRKSYDFKDSAKLVQTLSRIYDFCRVKGHVIIIFP
jgi:hypothetical protein